MSKLLKMESSKRPLIIHLQSNSKLNKGDSSETDSVPNFLNINGTEERNIPKGILGVATTAMTKTRNRDFEWNSLSAKRSFIKNWKELFPCIEYDRRKKIMFCKVCSTHSTERQQGIPFVSGTKNFRLSSILYHLNSSLHSKCLKLANNEKCSDVSLKTDSCKVKMLGIFKIVYFTIKTKKPFTSFQRLCKSREKQLGNTYTTHQKIVPHFSKYIALGIEKEISDKIKDLDLFTLVLETLFSKSDECHIIVYIKHLKEKELNTVFLGVIQPKSVCGKDVYENLTKLFHKYNFKNWSQCVVYIMLDITSRCSWVDELVSLVKENSLNNFVCVIPILPHHLEHIALGCASENSFREVLSLVYQYYKKNYKDDSICCSMGKAIDDFNEDSGYPNTKSFNLNFNMLDAINKDWCSLVRLLESSNSFEFRTSKLKCKMISEVTKLSFVLKLAIYLDVYKSLQSFSDKLQDEQFVPFSLCDTVEELCVDLNKAGTAEGPIFKHIIKDLCLTSSTFRKLSICLDTTVDIVVAEMQSALKVLHNHFTNIVSGDLSYLKNLQLFSTKDECGKSFNDCYSKLHGDEESLQPVITEWHSLRIKFGENSKLILKPKTVLFELIAKYRYDLPALGDVLSRIALLDFGAFELRDGFREMNLIKSVDRSSLSVSSLHNSMLIAIHGPSVSEYNPEAAFETWLKERKRRYRKCKLKKEKSLNLICL